MRAGQLAASSAKLWVYYHLIMVQCGCVFGSRIGRTPCGSVSPHPAAGLTELAGRSPQVSHTSPIKATYSTNGQTSGHELPRIPSGASVLSFRPHQDVPLLLLAETDAEWPCQVLGHQWHGSKSMQLFGYCHFFVVTRDSVLDR